MKRSGSILSFIAFAILVEAITLFLVNESITSTATAFGFLWAVVVFSLYKLSMDYNESNWVSAELRSYAVRSQPSNRLMFSFVASLCLIPMNGAVFSVDLSRLAFYQMTAVVVTEVLFEAVRKSWNHYTYKLNCKTTEKTKEESRNGYKLSKAANCVSN